MDWHMVHTGSPPGDAHYPRRLAFRANRLCHLICMPSSARHVAAKPLRFRRRCFWSRMVISALPQAFPEHFGADSAEKAESDPMIDASYEGLRHRAESPANERGHGFDHTEYGARPDRLR